MNTNTDQPPEHSAPPAIILVDPQLGENIGMVARAMMNCGLMDLRLVRPRDGWPNDRAKTASVGAAVVVETARVFASTAEAVADLQYLLATTARPRHSTQLVLTPHGAAVEAHQRSAEGSLCGVLFGKESRGLDNDDIARADAVITVPLNPAFTSLNLAQAVLLFGYEWFGMADRTPTKTLRMSSNTRPATKAELLGLFEHLEAELDACGFLGVADKRPTMARNLRNMFQRAGLTEQEVRTLRGVVSGLARMGRSRGI